MLGMGEYGGKKGGLLCLKLLIYGYKYSRELRSVLMNEEHDANFRDKNTVMDD
tara:strand:- start:536 stop:694 length:159 start_codon:yes stop_codon:yes gene_type:complete